MNDGWEDDEDLAMLDDDNSNAEPQYSNPQSLPIAQSSQLPDNAWEEDDALLDLDEDDDDDDAQDDGWNNNHCVATGRAPATANYGSQPYSYSPSNVQMKHSLAEEERSLVKELQAYVASLPKRATAINVRLHREFNTTAKAQELISYYAERPQLVQYTIETELPRMDYRLIDVDGTSWQSSDTAQQQEIATRLGRAASQDPIHSLLVRSANQSLLADPLHVIMTSETNSDNNDTALVRQAYMATCVADHVTISLHLPAAMVQLQAQLQVLVPAQQGRQCVARIHLNAAFGPSAEPEPPLVEYRIAHVELADDWASVVEPWALFLQEQRLEHAHEHDDWPTMTPEDEWNEGRNFRDSLVQQSQVLFQSSALGMQSAWSEVQAATGLKNKKLPQFLPTDVIQQAHEEEQSKLQATTAEHRPTSILGGLVKKGWTQLAKSVALPEEDESLYQAWQPLPQQSSSPTSPVNASAKLQLYRGADVHSAGVSSSTSPRNPFRKEPELSLYRTNNQQSIQSSSSSSPSLTLYRKDADEMSKGNSPQGTLSSNNDPPSFRQPNESPPRLYRLSDDLPTQPLPPPPPTTTARELYHHTEEVMDPVGEGWDDDDLELDDDDGDDDTGTEAVSAPVREVLHVKESQYSGATADWEYDPVTDVRPTRKRWVNPFPGPRRLVP